MSTVGSDWLIDVLTCSEKIGTFIGTKFLLAEKLNLVCLNGHSIGSHFFGGIKSS